MTTTDKGILLEAGTNEVEFIEFYLANQSYGINVAKVQHVSSRKAVTVTPLPKAPPHVLGVVYHRDEPINLIDLRSALGIQGEEQDPDLQLVLIAQFNKETTAFLIDGVHKIHRSSWDQFQPSSRLAGKQGSYTTGTVLIEERIVLILDMERLMLDFSTETDQDAARDLTAEESIMERRKGLRIVYAEDSSVIRMKTIQLLRQAGFEQIESFENGEEAFRYLDGRKRLAAEQGKTLSDFVDIILTDIEMPRMDGLTLCKNVKAGGGQGIPAVMVYSSLINTEMSRKCESVGADAQMSKPHGDEIVNLIDRLCLGVEGPTIATA